MLHNFLWHVRYTWNDRCGGAHGLRPFLRFQLSNGLVSLAGNVVIMWLLVQKAPGADDEESTIGIPQRLLTSLFGAGPLRDVAKRARADLLNRIILIFDEEMLRFSKIISEAEVPDAGAAVQLYQATYALEVTR